MILIRVLCTYSVWECEAWFPFNSTLSLKFWQKYMIPDKTYPNPNQTEIFIPDLIPPKYTFKKVSRSQTVFGLVQFSPKKVGDSGCPTGLQFTL